MNARLLDQVLRLSGEERLELIEKVWDSLADREVPVTDYEKSVLDERLVDIQRIRRPRISGTPRQGQQPDDRDIHHRHA